MTIAAFLVVIGFGGLKAIAATVAESPALFNGVGPVVAASADLSQLNSHARKFLEKNYQGVAVTRCVKDFPSQYSYVTLANGVEIEFDSKGRLLEIEAPDRATLPARVVKNIVPRSTYIKLDKEGFANEVESIKHDRFGYKIELEDEVYDEIRFDDSGIFVAVYTDD